MVFGAPGPSNVRVWSSRAVVCPAAPKRGTKQKNETGEEKESEILGGPAEGGLREGCLMVRSDHGPQAEVAQGVGPGPLVEL